MHVARRRDAPVLLVGDIDRGGVFAAFVGTLELLEPRRARAQSPLSSSTSSAATSALLEPGPRLAHRAHRASPCSACCRTCARLRIADEDSLSLDDRARRRRGPAPDALDIAIVRLPRISNYDDFDAARARSPACWCASCGRRDELEAPIW